MPTMKASYLGRDPQEFRLLTEFEGVDNGRSLAAYRGRKGYAALERILSEKMAAEQVTATVKDSGLRGRGGAGFPTGVKWGFVPKNSDDKYLICNFDEGEPGTFKDRVIAEQSPHMLIEGMLIAAYAIGARKSYIYIRGEFIDEARWCEQAIAEAYEANLLGNQILGSGFSHEMAVYRGAGAYICGEETGLISSLEGKKGQPKLKPPFPAVQGYLGKPTIVNNVETLAAIPYILREGAQAYRSFGTEKSPGTKLFNVSGPVVNPGCFELPLGYPLQRLIEDDAGGLLGGKRLKAIIPGGASSPVLTPAEINGLTLDYEAVAAAGSMLGSGAIIVVPEETSMVSLLANLMEFFAHESCGQCTPCREGTGWLNRICQRFLNGTAQLSDIDRIYQVADNMMGKTICVLSDAAAMPAKSIVQKFRPEFEAMVAQRRGTV